MQERPCFQRTDHLARNATHSQQNWPDRGASAAHQSQTVLHVLPGVPGHRARRAQACGLIFDAEAPLDLGLNLLVFFPMASSILQLSYGAGPSLTDHAGHEHGVSGIAWAVALLLIFQALQSPSLGGVLWHYSACSVFLLTNFINLWNRRSRPSAPCGNTFPSC